MSRLVDPNRPGGHSLGNWGEWLGVPKGDFNDWDEYSHTMLEYCIQDTKITLALFVHLSTYFTQYEQAIALEQSVQEALTIMEQTGFLLDKAGTESLKDELESELWSIEASLSEVFPDEVTYKQLKTKLKTIITPFNPGSRQQVAKRLMQLGWEPTEYTQPTTLHPKGQVKVDETTLEGVNIPEAQVIQRYFMLQKRISQLSQWLEYVEGDSRVRCKMIGNGAITGRATHSTPNLGQVVAAHSPYGKEFRSLWIVPKGRKLVGVDLKGLEGRCMAHYMQDEAYSLAVCEGTKELGTDIHSVNMRAFGLTDRDQAKTAFYALMYGAGPAKIATILKCSVAEARKTIDNFYRNLPALEKLKTKIERMASKGWLPGLDGRRIKVRSNHSALNTLFQGAGAVISKQWLVLVNEELRDKVPTARIVMWVHDELQVECDEEDANDVAELAKRCAIVAGQKLNLRLPIEADSKVGNNWYETH